jgi:hypothetical protein
MRNNDDRRLAPGGSVDGDICRADGGTARDGHTYIFGGLRSGELSTGGMGVCKSDLSHADLREDSQIAEDLLHGPESGIQKSWDRLCT